MGQVKNGTSFVKQAAILAGASLLVRVIGFLYRVPMTNILGDIGIGIYSTGYQFYNFLLILSSAGLPAAIGKMVSGRLAQKQYRNAHKVFRVAMIWSSIISFIFMVLLFFSSGLIENLFISYYEDEQATSFIGLRYTLMTLSPTILIVGIMAVFRGYFQGMRNMIPTATSQIIEQIFNAIFSVVLALLLFENSIALGAAGGTAGTGIGAFFGLIIMIFAYFLVKPKIDKKMKVPVSYQEETSKEIAKELFRTAMPIILGTAIYSITNLADTFMVPARLSVSGAFTGDEAMDLYGQLQGKYATLTTLPIAISTAMATAAIPSISYSMSLKDRKTVERKINLAIKTAMIISIPAAVGMGVLAHQILLLLFPSAPKGGDLLAIGSISIVFLALSQIVTGTLQGIGKVKIPAMNAFFGAVVKIILNYFLIVNPDINVKGAVISTIGCYIVASSLNLFALIRVTKFTPDLVGALVKPTFSSLIMGVICYFSYKGMFAIKMGNTLSTLLAVVIGVGVYGIVMLLIKGISHDELRAMPMGNKMIVVFEKLNLL